jgi:hypothetical protein
MSSRFQITDADSNTLTLQLSENWGWGDYNGRWLPDVPGKVSSSTDWDRNPYEYENVDGFPLNAHLFTYDSLGYRRRVMSLTKIIGSILYEDSGTGYLSYYAAITLKGGTISWRKL